jgi:hypothetical protein
MTGELSCFQENNAAEVVLRKEGTRNGELVGNRVVWAENNLVRSMPIN